MLRIPVLLFLLAGCSGVAGAEPSRTVQEFRSHMFDAPLRSLANRTIKMMFNTATVGKGTATSTLPGVTGEMAFTYNYAGVTHKADDIVERTFTDAILIMKNGRIVVEQYYNRADDQTYFNSFSMAKSINAVLVGLAIRDGKIKSVDEPLSRYVPNLSASGYKGTTIRNLMEMRSGVSWDDNFFAPDTLSHAAHVASWIEERQRYTDTAVQTSRGQRPGTVFNYNSMDAALVGLAVERAVGMPVSRYLSERLWIPAGMEADAFYLLDGPEGMGREFTAGGFNARLRDYGRLGLFMLNKGKIGSTSLLPDSYVADLSQPGTAEADEGLGYGWLWWTVRGTRAYTALGGEGQFIFIDPDTDTVVVKLSHGPVGPDAVPLQAEAIAFLKAASQWDGPQPH